MKLCNLNTSKALQELGYDGEYTSDILPDGRQQNLMAYALLGTRIENGGIPCPRLDDAAYWLRDKHGINICVNPSPGVDKKTECFMYRIDAWDEAEGWWWTDCYNDELAYEDALEAAVTKAIEIINSRNKSERELHKSE